ncbi:MAG TPA: LysR family transcriptional regulator [Steroidobacteraceae bacterium]|jgi:DNA-binding transcriptional LysR family regulator|nr:LysR family transcriptional regulator [Steroidobacteraceae bacterium]
MTLPRTTLEQWGVLAAVIDRGGFAPAAQALHRSQSAISYAIGRLQQSLGVALLSIQGRKAVLTQHGETLLRRARPLLQDLATLEDLAASLDRGWESQLNLVVDVAFPRERLLRIVSELGATCPHTPLQLSDAVLSGAEEAITAQSADVVVTSRVPAGYLGDFLMEVPFIAVAHPDHPLLRLQRPLTATDLAHHTQVVVRDSGLQEPRDEGWLGAERRFTVSSMEASLAMVTAGLAFAWLPEHLVAPAIAAGSARALSLLTGARRHVSLYLVLVHAEVAGPAAREAARSFARHAPITRAPPA